MVLVKWLLLSLLLSGCSALLGVHDFTPQADATSADASGTRDDATDAMAGFCIGAPTGLGPFCMAAAPTMAFDANVATTMATDMCAAGTIVSVHGRMVCEVAATDITISAGLRAIGAYPLVLVASNTITVTAAIDVASRAGSAGAGAGVCQSGAGLTGSSTGSGGAGGSFGARGGAGGGVNNGAIPGGTPGPIQSIAALRLQAGCDGGRGGMGQQPGGLGGAPGGAIYLAAGTSIDIHAQILAGGAGGIGGGKNAGGGGGGSGGLIGLDAPAINLAPMVILVANGGGGASGNQNNALGHPGNDAAGLAPALGGDGNNGNAGGDGSLGGDGGLGGSAQNLGIGAGGGGGAAGIIFVVGTVANQGASVSPATVTR